MGCSVGVDAVLMRWGEAKRYADRITRDVALIVRLSGSTGLDDGSRWPSLLHSVEGSLALGGDAVCIDVEVGGSHEAESLRSLAGVCEEAERLGCVVLAEVHTGAPSGQGHTSELTDGLAWGARTAQETGADLVKVAYPGSSEAVAQICELAQIPVVTAGGDPRQPREVLRAVGEALRGGAAGSAVGRNVIGHASPAAMQQAVIDLVRGRGTVDDVSERLLSPASA